MLSRRRVRAVKVAGCVAALACLFHGIGALHQVPLVFAGPVQQLSPAQLGNGIRRRSATSLPEASELDAEELPLGAPNMPREKVDEADFSIEDFYTETISGEGGKPSGILRDMISMSTGNGDVLGVGDHEAGFKALKSKMIKGEHSGEDDGSGWIWLVADQDKNGLLSLDVMKELPRGKRPIAVAKDGEVEEMFQQLNWVVCRRRLNEVLGPRRSRSSGPRVRRRFPVRKPTGVPAAQQA
mmetsp:Transcript_39878/g.89439  ORF Transcript_39878/g.89439 Transcript_39878/m.89439 type:complete len:240 (+) Transcript_39878:27-746(+)